MLKNIQTVFPLGLILAFRMLGLFMILPVFSAYAGHYTGSTPALIGLALGVYGLTQACLQIPFGFFSDRIGRKPVIALGLVLFCVGSIIAAMSHGITGVIIGRAIQGGGAVGSTLLACVADLTLDEHRTKAMAFIGLFIGVSFSIAMVVGPLLNTWFGLSGIFWVTALLAIAGIILLYTAVPPIAVVVSSENEPAKALFKRVLSNTQLLRLDLGIFMQHATMTALFLVIPILLGDFYHFGQMAQTIFYLVILVVAFFCMVPLVIVAEKYRKMKGVFILNITLLLVGLLLVRISHTHWFLVAVALWIFFTAFTALEATLPSLVSKTAPITSKGTAMGVYSSSQFLGIFVGGALGGLAISHFGYAGAIWLGVIFVVIWWLAAISMQKPPHLSTKIFKTPAPSHEQLETLNANEAIAEVAYSESEGLLYVKVDRQLVGKYGLQSLLEQSNLLVPDDQTVTENKG